MSKRQFNEAADDKEESKKRKDIRSTDATDFGRYPRNDYVPRVHSATLCGRSVPIIKFNGNIAFASTTYLYTWYTGMDDVTFFQCFDWPSMIPRYENPIRLEGILSCQVLGTNLYFSRRCSDEFYAVGLLTPDHLMPHGIFSSRHPLELRRPLPNELVLHFFETTKTRVFVHRIFSATEVDRLIMPNDTRAYSVARGNMCTLVRLRREEDSTFLNYWMARDLDRAPEWKQFTRIAKNSMALDDGRMVGRNATDPEVMDIRRVPRDDTDTECTHRFLLPPGCELYDLVSWGENRAVLQWEGHNNKRYGGVLHVDDYHPNTEHVHLHLPVTSIVRIVSDYIGCLLVSWDNPPFPTVDGAPIEKWVPTNRHMDLETNTLVSIWMAQKERQDYVYATEIDPLTGELVQDECVSQHQNLLGIHRVSPNRLALQLS